MESLRLILAILLPWITGFIWMGLFWRHDSPGALAARLGYGYFAGALLTALIQVSFDGLGLPQHFWATLVALGVLAVWGHGLFRLLLGSSTLVMAPQPRLESHWSGLNWRHALVSLLLLLLAVRFGNFLLEIIWRPLYPWDAFTCWALPGRNWIEQGTLVQDYCWLHPQLISLIQYWPALALGYWDESLINLPWFFCALGLALAVYGQSRTLGGSPLFALLLCYLLLSLPFLDVHIMLAGYADVWLGTLYALATLAFVRWVWQRDYRQAALALGLALLLPLIKLTGFLWPLTFIAALFLWLFPGRWLLVATVLGGGGLILWYFNTGIDLTLPFRAIGFQGRILISPEQIIIPGYKGPGLKFFPVGDAFIQNFYYLGNWHLVWYLVPIATLWAVVYAWRDRLVAVALAPVVTGLASLFFIFFFSETYSRNWAENYTGLNRVFLNLVPALVVTLGAILIRYRKQVAELRFESGDTWGARRWLTAAVIGSERTRDVTT